MSDRRSLPLLVRRVSTAAARALRGWMRGRGPYSPEVRRTDLERAAVLQR
jgi:hypothetical protein